MKWVLATYQREQLQMHKNYNKKLLEKYWPVEMSKIEWNHWKWGTQIVIFLWFDCVEFLAQIDDDTAAEGFRKQGMTNRRMDLNLCQG